MSPLGEMLLLLLRPQTSRSSMMSPASSSRGHIHRAQEMSEACLQPFTSHKAQSWFLLPMLFTTSSKNKKGKMRRRLSDTTRTGGSLDLGHMDENHTEQPCAGSVTGRPVPSTASGTTSFLTESQKVRIKRQSRSHSGIYPLYK